MRNSSARQPGGDQHDEEGHSTLFSSPIEWPGVRVLSIKLGLDSEEATGRSVLPTEVCHDIALNDQDVIVG